MTGMAMLSHQESKGWRDDGGRHRKRERWTETERERERDGWKKRGREGRKEG